MSSIFSRLHESLQQVLAQRLDWTELREVQERTYAAVAAGNDTLVIAPTAGGKSEAALIPVMDDLLKHGRTGVVCLYIAPLKALINDQEERFSAFCIPTSLSVMKWHGDVSRGERSWKDGEPPHFLMITPESLEVLFHEKTLSPSLRQVRYIIVDELHAFVETERGVHLKVLLDRMDRIAQRKIQRIGLSATTGNPDEVLRWLSDSRHGETLVSVPSAPQEKEFRFIIEPEENKRIEALVRIVTGKKALVFVNSRSVAEYLAQSLVGRIKNLRIHHSSLSTATRRSAEEAFSAEGGACIICTSTLELGIDIGDLDIVVQVSPPTTVSSFLQRMGRSGRRGKAANVAWILKNPCELLCSCAIIECAMGKVTENLIPQKKPYPVLLQQLFLYLHHRKSAGRRQLEMELLSHPVFSSIGEHELNDLISHLMTEGYLTSDGELLMPGNEAERIFGRSNWKDLYSVISSGGEYRAVTPEGDVIGNLDARFIRSHDSGGLSLGGRSWSVVKRDEGHNLIVVVPGETGSSRIFWTGGGTEEGYSPLICRMIQKILARGGSHLPLAEPEQDILKQVSGHMPQGTGETGLTICERITDRRREVIIYSLQGSRFNQVLSILLKRELGGQVQVRYSDFSVRVLQAGSGEGATNRVLSAILELRTLSRSATGAALPMPRQEPGKFARLLPLPLYREMILADYYHIDEYMDRIRDLSLSTGGEGATGKSKHDMDRLS
ncbi:DEAD/DEAH box helicase [uncultured Methanoregula sp.]|uniref:DEAD/DEAH box helicase n=1 Tax=uncultured Methanoregula sp. TaxID=1005933 RepID=UPI002AAA8816|nr:DEAD/DEAH box helicase [uncultured Methanoregula sp.]